MNFKSLILAGAAFASVAVMGSATPAAAKGCIKGAIVGGVAGHYAGRHGVLGAVGGCIAGRKLANDAEKRKLQEQQVPPEPAKPSKSY